MKRTTKKSILLAGLLSLVPVIPGAIANRILMNQMLAALEGQTIDLNIYAANGSMLIAPGVIAMPVLGICLAQIGTHGHFYFILNLAQAFTAWIVYFTVLFLALLWRQSRTSPTRAPTEQHSAR